MVLEVRDSLRVFFRVWAFKYILFLKECHEETGRKKTQVKSSRLLTLFLKENTSHCFSFHDSLHWNPSLGHYDELPHCGSSGPLWFFFFFLSSSTSHPFPVFMHLMNFFLYLGMFFPYLCPLLNITSETKFLSPTYPDGALLAHCVELTPSFFASLTLISHGFS